MQGTVSGPPPQLYQPEFQKQLIEKQKQQQQLLEQQKQQVAAATAVVTGKASTQGFRHVKAKGPL